MTDYQINLAKQITSTPEQRRKFYHGMLLYLVLCAAAMVYTAYLTSLNVTRALQDNYKRKALMESATAFSDLGSDIINNPEDAYQDLQKYAKDVDVMRTALAGRSRLLPVITGLFAEFPDNVSLQALESNTSAGKISFSLVVPVSDQERIDPVRRLQTLWGENDELMKFVSSIRPVTGERRTVAGAPVFVVQFECVLKK